MQSTLVQKELCRCKHFTQLLHMHMHLASCRWYQQGEPTSDAKWNDIKRGRKVFLLLLPLFTIDALETTPMMNDFDPDGPHCR